MTKRHLILSVLLCLPVAAEDQTATDWNAAGVEYYQAGQWYEAIQSFSEAYELTPLNTVVRRNLCNAHQAAANELAKVADFAEAAKHLEIAIGVDPENPSPLVQLSSYYLRLDMVTEATHHLEEATELDPDNVSAHDLLGDAFYKTNDLPSALAQWEWVLEMQPDRPGVREKLEKANRQHAVERMFHRDKSRHFRASYNRGAARSDLRKVFRILERAYIEVGRKFGNIFPSEPVQIIIYTAAGFSEATQLEEHVGAVYDGKIRVPLLDRQGNTIPPHELQRRLTHEYVHVIVRYLLFERAPWWLNEGLAQTFSEELNPATTEALRRARQEGALFALKDLEGGQLEIRGVQDLRMAYAQAHATVRNLWDRFGQRRLTSMLSDLAEGMEAEQALRRNYQRTYELLEREVSRGLGDAPAS